MKILIIYDSLFCNTEKIARAISNGFSSQTELNVVKVSEVKPEYLTQLNLLIVGSPTRAFRPSPAIDKLLKSIPKRSLKDVKVAAFDTRISIEDIDSRMLSIMAKLFGYAAKPIADKLRKKGGNLIISPEGFFVEDTEGPLKKGELERALEWQKKIIAAL